MIADEREELFIQAMRALYAYKLSLTEELHGEILKMESEADPLDGPAPGMLEVYRDVLWRIEVAESALRAGIIKAQKEAGRGKDIFTCAKCAMRIRREHGKCRVCGWSWRPLSA